MFLLSSELADPTLIIDPITEERASRTLYRIELLRRIREQVLPNPLLSERLKLCQPSPDLPEWWECGRHDHDLLLGASKHGVSRTDYHILNDPALAFLEAHQRFTGLRGSTVYSAGQGEPQRAGPGVAESAATLLTPAELASAAAGAAKGEEGEKEEVKTGDDKSELEGKMDTDEVGHIKTETPEEEMQEQGEAEDGSNETAASPQALKAEESRSGAEAREQNQEPDAETVKAPDDGDVAAETEKVPAEACGEQKEVATKLPEQCSPKDQSTAEERDAPDSPKSPKSADTVKTAEEEDEERMDEDDKSEKSSQAEGKDAQVVIPG